MVQYLIQVQRIAKPLLYRHVHIHNHAAARMLVKRMSHLSITRGIDTWRWVQTFREGLTGPSLSGITELFLRAANLMKLQTSIPVSAEIFATLRHSCPSLRSLDVWAHTGSHGVMAQVGLFEHVKELRITPHPCVSSADLLTDVPAWNMPAVTHFWWGDTWNELPHGASFISRCRFPQLTHLNIHHTHFLLDPEHTCRFLDAHRSIIYLRLAVKEDWQLRIVPFVRARNFQMACTSWVPSRAFVPLLRSEVKI
jgi:hypothetical protein